METYTPTNFRKYQHAIFENLDKTKKPIEITTSRTKENGANKGYVLMTKDVYQQLTALQSEQVRQAEADIRHYALSHDPKTPENESEMEEWLNAD